MAKQKMYRMTDLRCYKAVFMHGMSLIEIMVGLTIAMLASLVVINAFSSNESLKRNTTGASDAAQSGNILSRYLQKTLEDAGSALTTDEGIWGCRMFIKVGGTQLYPRTSALSSPFDGIPLTLRAAPVIAIDSGSTSNTDTLLIMTGRPAGSSQDYVATYLSTLNLSPTPAIGFNASDYLLAYSTAIGNTNVADCQTLKVSSSYTPASVGAVMSGFGAKPIGAALSSVSLDSNYGTPSSSDSLFIRNLGNNPSLIALSVNASQSLQQLSFLDSTFTPSTVAENIVALKVRYGVDTSGDNVIDSWVAPTDTWSAATLLDGTQVNAARIKQIQAIRVGVVVRSSQIATQDAANTSVTLFPDLASISESVSISMTGSNARYQYQVFDITVPLRNPRYL